MVGRQGGSQGDGAKQVGTDETLVRRIFRWSLIFKAADSVVEIVSGAVVYFVSDRTILSVAGALTRHELAENPQDPIANFLMHSAETLAVNHRSVAAAYLISHGAIKLFLVTMVLRDKAWAYPAFMVALVLLIAYQCFQLWHSFSPWLAALTIFDVVVLWLTVHEYRDHRAMRAG